jgi:CRP-like cAMP-binding protein
MVPDVTPRWKPFVLTAPRRAAQHDPFEDEGGTVTLTREQTTRLLAETRLFTGVDPDGLARIADRISEVEVPADRVLARQGEIGTGFFIVAEGMVRVVRDGDTLAELGPGDFFGELSVLDGKPRNAQVVSTQPTTCLALASWEFEAVVREQPSVALAILRELAGRLRDLTETHRH